MGDLRPPAPLRKDPINSHKSLCCNDLRHMHMASFGVKTWGILLFFTVDRLIETDVSP